MSRSRSHRRRRQTGSGQQGPQAIQAALAWHQQGQLDQARQAYCEILEHDPSCADAWHLLGMLLYQSQQAESALECLDKAVAFSSGNAQFHCHRGVILLALKRLADASVSLTKSIQLDRNVASAHNNLGVVLLEIGDFERAEFHLRRALELDSHAEHARSNLGNALQKQNRVWEALAQHEQAVAETPMPMAKTNLAETYRQLERLDEAHELLDAVLAEAPGLLEANINYCRILIAKDRCSEAARRLHALREIHPGSAAILHYIGESMAATGHHRDAIPWFAASIQRNAAYSFAHTAMAQSYQRLGEHAKAVDCWRQAVELAPRHHGTHSSYLFALSSDDRLTPTQLAEAHFQWGQVHGQVPAIGDFTNRDWCPSRRLRVGYVSPDLRTHAVTAFFEPVLRCHDRDQFEITCYANVAQPDATTDRLRELANGWQFVWGWSDRQVAERICRDQIDILVDLAGHTAANRLRSFAYRPAPVQCTWLGYPNTTGLPAIDYFITNPIQDPPHERYHVEQLARLNSDTCFAPPAVAPAVAPLPALERGFITFGSFHRYQKFAPAVFDLWSRCLQAVPSSRLIMFNTGFSRETIECLHREFTRRGVDSRRIDIHSETALPHYLHLYHQVDLALDVFPWNGGTTVREALWMGVPTVALMGDRRSARATAAAMHRVGLTSWIATGPDEYVDRVSAVANQFHLLAEVRHSLRRRMQETHCNAVAVTLEIERAFREMWRAARRTPVTELQYS